MKFNLFQLHDAIQDNNNRKLLRIYSTIPRFSKIKIGPMANQAIFVTAFLNRINHRLKKQVSPTWKDQWLSFLGYPYSKTSCKDWFIGRASIPLVALEKLKLFGLEKDINDLIENIVYVSSTTNEVILIPEDYSLDLLYLSGVILGDGSLPISHRTKHNNFEYKITISSSDKENLLKCKEIFDKLFSSNSKVYYKSGKNGSSWIFERKSKIVYRFFTNIMKIPNGKKSIKATISREIKAMPPPLQSAFLAGLVDSDIGKHGNGMGATFRSKEFVFDLIEILSNYGIVAKHYGTHYKNKKYIQNDFRIPKGQIRKFKDVLESNYLPKRKDRLKTLYSLAGVP